MMMQIISNLFNPFCIRIPTSDSNSPQTPSDTGIHWIKIQKTKPFITYDRKYDNNIDQEKSIQLNLIRSVISPEEEKEGYLGDYVYNGDLKEVLRYYESTTISPSNSHLKLAGNGFYSAFAEAWARHGRVIISPDDVWIAIQLQFNKYLEQNAESLRSIFVDHQEKRDLNIDMGDCGENWPIFMERIIGAIRANVKSNINDLLPVFSSTTPIQMNMKHLAVMDNMKQYFTYTMAFVCGIESIGFIGTLDDWKLLKETVIKLRQFHLDTESKYFPSLNEWINELVLILNEFIQTYQNKINRKFWNKIFQKRSERGGSGGASYIKGWFNVFLTNYYKDELDVGSIPQHRFNVPVTIDNNGHITRVAVQGGFTGIQTNLTEKTFRPHLSYAVIEKPTG